MIGMMGMQWLLWVVVAVVVLRLVTRRGRWGRGWMWYDDWLDSPYPDGRLSGRGARGRRYVRGHRQRRLERRREALEDAADRLEEASARLRGRARGGGPTTDDRRPSIRSSGVSGSRRLSGAGNDPGSRRASASPEPSRSEEPTGRQAPARKSAETRLETLQRRFAQGRITMEQYERELDKLYGLN